MEEKHDSRFRFNRSALPWVIGGAALLLYLVTLSRWVTLASLPFAAKVGGWDWTLPQQAPLFFLLTMPFRWLPASVQPLFLNAFAAVCGALALVLLARSVALLPHDRTHEQRQRERSHGALLTTRLAWLPPVFASAVLGLQLTFWQHATAATTETLDLMLFAYVIRCLLEYRIDRRQGWLYRFTFVYGLAVANNWAMIGFAPLFLVAVIWILGREFLQLGLLVRMTLGGLAGLSLYLLLPLLWSFSDTGAGFFETLRAQLGLQKIYLLHVPGLRNRALVISLTSILPVVIIGIRWPSSFGDTSAAGTMMANLMFRVLHAVFLVACLWIMFDQKFSPRALGMGIPFLTFYFLSALAVGYFSGYFLLLASESRSSRVRGRRSKKGLGPVMQGAVCAGLVVVSALLAYKNWPIVRVYNSALLLRLAEQMAESLPASPTTVISDDGRAALLLKGYLNRQGEGEKHMVLLSTALPLPPYQRHLAKEYPTRWTDLTDPDEPTLKVSPFALLQALEKLAQEAAPQPLYYLHPSFGYYFERFYQKPSGLIVAIRLYPDDRFLPPPVTDEELSATERFWDDQSAWVERLEQLPDPDYQEASFLTAFYSRALNAWGVTLQRNQKIDEATPHFAQAVALTTNNIPAQINLAFNRSVTMEGQPFSSATEAIEFRSWDKILAQGGPFDTPELCLRLGEGLAGQSLYRQAAIETERSIELDPSQIEAWISLANIYLLANRPDRVLELIEQVESNPKIQPTVPERQLELIRLEAGALFAREQYAEAEDTILAALEQYPNDPGLFSTLLEIYMAGDRWEDALQAVEKRLAGSKGGLELQFTEAKLLLRLERTEEALNRVEQILESDPRNLQAQLFKGAVLLQDQRYTNALEQFEKVLREDPDNQDALLSQGAAYLQTAQFDKAVASLSQVLKKHPRNWAALRNRAIANLRRGELKEAQRDYENLLKVLPRHYAAYFGLGEIAYRQKRSSDAVRYYELYLRHAPQVSSPELTQERQQVEQRLAELKSGSPED